MHRFYIPEVSGDNCKLSEEESKHCVRVLRLQKDDAVEILDGKGNRFQAVIDNANPKACTLKITEHIHEPSPKWELIIAVAPTKNIARMEWLVEKLTEVGFTKFFPIECHNSERTVLKTERLKKIAIEAMKQSGKSYLPAIYEMTTIEELLDTFDCYGGEAFIAHLQNGERKTLSSTYKKGKGAIVIIGPEGDFTKDEIAQAIDNGFIPVVLNENTLRTETAALVAACTLHAINE